MPHTPQSPNWCFWSYDLRTDCCQAPVVYDYAKKRTHEDGTWVQSSLICWECDLPYGGALDDYHHPIDRPDKWTEFLNIVRIMEK